MAIPIHVLGGAQTDFAKNWSASGEGLFDMLEATVAAALDQARVPATDVEVAHVGNLAAELFCGQAQIGGLLATVDPAFSQLPTSRHEAACASGSMAVLGAAADLEARRYEVALVVGIEMMRNTDAATAANHLGSAAWAGREAVDAEFPWPELFDEIADACADRYGLAYEHLARIAEINYANAKRNPQAQTRDWSLGTGCFSEDDDVNPVVAGRLRKYDCGRITDGAAAVVLAAAPYAERWANRTATPLDQAPVIRGWGHRTAPMLLADKLALSSGTPYLFPHVRTAVTDAYRRAGVSGAEQIDVIETHDCFTITEYVALDHLGLAPAGHAWQAIEDGVIDPTGAVPVNPSGGLLGLGHPVGATGVRMVLDAQRQVTGTAGECQVDGARTAATLNVGGSFTTVAAFVVGV